ncbi:MAG: hypothetical protein WCY21_01075 [Candidatus Cloacimonadaceae bacterium]
MTKEKCLEVGKILIKHHPVFFEGYARSFVDFYNTLAEHGMEIPKPKSVFCYGETITPKVRDFIESKFEAPLFDHYGNRELTACIDQFPDGKQYLTEDYFYPEILSSEGNIEAHGYGELVSTGIYNNAMPLIRYRTRDFVKVHEYKKNSRFACREVEAIEGRMDDYLLLPDGRKIYFAEGALGYAEGVVAAQYVQDEKDHVTVNLVVDAKFNKDFYKMIEQGLKKRIGDSIRFSFRIVPELEKKGSGKTPFIINKVTK